MVGVPTRHVSWHADGATIVRRRPELRQSGPARRDITTADPRYNTLPRADRRSVLRDALTSLHALESVDTQITQSVVAECGPVLAEEFADLSMSSPASTRELAL